MTKVSVFLATGCGVGTVKYFPGTIGTLWGWASFFILDSLMGDFELAIFIGFSFLIGVFISSIADKKIGKEDPSEIVIDEIVAIWFVLLFVPSSLENSLIIYSVEFTDFFYQLAAFIMFRFFDIIKPWPVNLVDSKIKGGFGIMFDDLVAGFQTLIVLSIFFKSGML